MHETRRQPLLASGAFIRRLLAHLGISLYAGLVFIAIAALVLGPVVHRVLHRFHLDKG